MHTLIASFDDEGHAAFSIVPGEISLDQIYHTKYNYATHISNHHFEEVEKGLELLSQVYTTDVTNGRYREINNAYNETQRKDVL